ncbi:MAG: hypothetical protein JXR78_19025, partial [Victivallales bacterium]|nr:hypothetical protein [Victivallales bacterium]
LLEPGTNPHQNAIFLTVLAAIIKAVDTHADLLRIAVSGAGNDHRLGANEAPPAIISIFLGEQLYDIIEQIEAGGAQSSKPNGTMQVGVDTIPILPKDATDRNRTSPFAFTGNKFEFRAVGSSQNCAGPNTVLNTIVAEAMDEISTELEKLSPEKFNEGLQKVLQSIIKKHKRILFNGDNYSENWAREAESRGLLNMRSTPEALKAFVSDKNIKLFEKYAVLSTRELEARHEIFVEMYETLIQIEAETALNIVKTAIFPAVIGYQSKIVQNISSLNSIGVKTGVEAQKTMAEKIGAGIDAAATATSKLEESIGCAESSVSAMLELRKAVDSLELLVEDSVWPLAKYSELLFIY